MFDCTKEEEKKNRINKVDTFFWRWNWPIEFGCAKQPRSEANNGLFVLCVSRAIDRHSHSL